MDEPRSKTQKKRDAQALQKIGMKLVDLSPEKLDSLPLNDSLKQAILLARSLKSHGAMRRQAQLIGKLMRVGDSDELVAAYEGLLAEKSAQTATFHELELWRDRLIHEGATALTEFVDVHKPADIQMLRQLIKKAVFEESCGKHTGASRALFCFLRSCVL